MKVWVYAICRNELPIIGYFLRHYSAFAEKIIIYDGNSNDGTREEIRKCEKAELRNFEGCDALVDDQFLYYSNEKWKEARGKADWVAWVDCDELLYHHDILWALKEYKQNGYTVVRTQGYTMVSDAFPTGDAPLTEQVRTGFPDWEWSKPALFQPHIEMCWNVGRHSVNETLFTPVLTAREVKLLHYRALGMDYLRERHARNWARVPGHCRERNYGRNCDPEHLEHHGLRWFEDMMKRKWPEVIP